MRWLLQEFVIRKLDVVITNSEYMKSRIVEKYRCVVVERLYYTAYDYSKIEFRWNERARDSPVRILFAKNDFIRGGLKELLAALRILDAHTFILTIAGPSEDDVVKKLSKSLRNTRHVEVVFRGPVTTASEMVGLYHQHDLLCIPSRKEALGLAIAEAVACGTPVITTTAGGIREVMNGDNNGFLSAPGDIAGLVANLRECLSDRKETHRKTLAGRKFILERFDINTMFQTLDSILNASMSSVGPDYTPVKSA
jgi:glycosyltransferase involved in cell wall biosynthesis